MNSTDARIVTTPAQHRMWRQRYGLWALAAVAGMLTGYQMARASIGTVRQPLVGGAITDGSSQEDFGLLGYTDGSGACSASLLRNGWAITAAHCVEVKNAEGNFSPDPKRPGQNMLKSIVNMTLTANWKTEQTQRVQRVDTFRPYDIALLTLDAPFNVRGSTKGYSRLIFQDGQFPYFGEPVGANLLVFGQGISRFATGEGDTAIPSVNDGLYRMGYAKATRNEDNLYWYPSEGGQMIAGGDSGGPSFAWVLAGYALVGVHSKAHITYVPGKPKTGWMWVTSAPEAADAPIAPVWQQIARIMGPAPAGDPEPAQEPPPPGFIGTFAATPRNYQPMWVYAIQPNGKLLWYRKDSGEAPWQGPKQVGTGWTGLKDMIPAGGNSFYALTADDKLVWYQHNGFNDGTFNWKGPVQVGRGWTFSRIFSGGEGIVYGIKPDGKLIWARHNGYADGGGMDTWGAAREVGSGWGDFKSVFSAGQGSVYAVTQDGKLMLYQQKDYANGVKDWYPARQIDTGWGDFRQIAPAGDGVILAVQNDGKLLWYRRSIEKPANALARVKEKWEGPLQIGSGWQDFGKVVALLPAASAVR